MPEGYQVKKRNTDYFAKLCFNQYLFIYLFIFLHATVVSSDNCPPTKASAVIINQIQSNT